MTTITLCPHCGRENKLADAEGYTEGPREYHADCWRSRGEAYHTGYEAAQRGESEKTNPYPSGTWDADEWLSGHGG